jgi:ribonuclease Z
MVEGMRTMFAHDLEKRSTVSNLIENLEIKMHPLNDGLVFDEGGIKVTAFPVELHDGNPTYCFRVDYAGYSVGHVGRHNP